MEPENRGNDTLIHEDEFLDSGTIVPLSQRDALIVEMYEDGLSTYDIAIQLELNRHTISRVLKENRIETRTIADYHKFKHEDIELLF
ncbi:MAG: helix-turn-helix domain-containing protein, partial [Candidatus Heimdallarchaeota archaeon]|nr:helix-turn-helix domain-containing protein [Candidatus Heimdallarchaeota archaeon]